MARPHVTYVSYDGMAEPLGRSQVLGYLERLAAGHDITLISFEKDDAQRPALAAELAAEGIDWRPQRYHRRPPVVATALDVASGVRALRAAERERPADAVHVRSTVPALVALLARIDAKLLFDIRGFWADERVEGGLWPAGGLLHRLARRAERAAYARADAVVTLTEASRPRIAALTQGRDVEVAVIPTCTDPHAFAGSGPRPDGPRAVWTGSIGTWYRFDLAAPLADALGLPLRVLTRQGDEARRVLAGHPAEVAEVAPGAMGAELRESDVGLCLIASKPSKVASAPTRFAEHLAAGQPVVVTRGVGDLEELVRAHRVGAVLADESPAALAAAAREALALAADPDARERCRALAREAFDVGAGAERYAALYARMLS